MSTVFDLDVVCDGKSTDELLAKLSPSLDQSTLRRIVMAIARKCAFGKISIEKLGEILEIDYVRNAAPIGYGLPAYAIYTFITVSTDDTTADVEYMTLKWSKPEVLELVQLLGDSPLANTPKLRQGLMSLHGIAEAESS